MFFEKLGSHEITVSAYDNAGNLAQAQQQFTVSADETSTINNIERAYELGWIEKESIENHLIKDLEAVIKLEAREEQTDKIELKIDKILGKKFLDELEKKYQKQLITVAAYNLLKEDVEWMMNH